MTAFYHLRVVFNSTSDWSTLDLKTPSAVLTMRLLEIEGSPDYPAAESGHLAISQNISKAQAGESVGLMVDFAINASAASQPLEFLLQKGDLNASRVDVFCLVGDELTLLQSIEHEGVVAGGEGVNALAFTVNLADVAQTALVLKPSERRADVEKMVWAFYYPWYSLETWSEPVFNDRPLHPYASADVAVMTRHLDEARAAGIDGFLSSWWGPGSDTDQNFGVLMDLAADRDFKVAIYFETLAGAGDTPLPEEQIYTSLAYALRTHGSHPAWMQVYGKPLVVLYSTNAVPLAAWRRVFERLRSEGLDFYCVGMGYDLADLEVFDTLHEYVISFYPNLSNLYQQTASGLRRQSLLTDVTDPHLWIATVQPGYDETLLPGREGLFVDRRDGDYYRSTWQAALASDPDWIFITSFNEFWENTHIEPSRFYGDAYMNITAEYTAQFKP